MILFYAINDKSRRSITGDHDAKSSDGLELDVAAILDFGCSWANFLLWTFARSSAAAEFKIYQGNGDQFTTGKFNLEKS